MRDPILRWKRVHGGRHHHFDGQVVSKGGILKARASELSKVIQAGFECLDTVHLGDESKGLKLIARPSETVEGMYDLVNPITGHPFNDTDSPLSRDEVSKIATFETDDEDEEPQPDASSLLETVRATRKKDSLMILLGRDEFVSLREWAKDLQGIQGLKALKDAMLEILEQPPEDLEEDEDNPDDVLDDLDEVDDNDEDEEV